MCRKENWEGVWCRRCPGKGTSMCAWIRRTQYLDVRIMASLAVRRFKFFSKIKYPRHEKGFPDLACHISRLPMECQFQRTVWPKGAQGGEEECRPSQKEKNIGKM